jgi:DNA-binding GntR family transcriptional regulator
MQEDFAKVNETAGHDGLLYRIRQLVLSGDFPPGAVLPEAFLAQEFDVSRTPIREALKQLQHEGLVEIRPKVGTFVREPTRREIIELFQLKESMEGLAASLLARRGEVPELSVLRRNLEESEMASLTHDTDAYATLVHEFHWTIVRGSDNNKLVEHYGRLMNQLAYQRLVVRTVEHPGRLEASTREHRVVLEMIEHKDPFGAESAMRNHVHASSREALSDPAAGLRS